RFHAIASITTFTLMLVAPVAIADTAPGATEIYKTKCSSCHGPDGSGQTPVGKSLKIRDLRSADVQKQTDADLVKVISDGRGKMPAYKTKVSVADITSLVAFIRGLAKK